jgi:hypothetical protein
MAKIKKHTLFIAYLNIKVYYCKHRYWCGDSMKRHVINKARLFLKLKQLIIVFGLYCIAFSYISCEANIDNFSVESFSVPVENTIRYGGYDTQEIIAKESTTDSTISTLLFKNDVDEYVPIIFLSSGRSQYYLNISNVRKLGDHLFAFNYSHYFRLSSNGNVGKPIDLGLGGKLAIADYRTGKIYDLSWPKFEEINGNTMSTDQLLYFHDKNSSKEYIAWASHARSEKTHDFTFHATLWCIEMSNPTSVYPLSNSFNFIVQAEYVTPSGFIWAGSSSDAKCGWGHVSGQIPFQERPASFTPSDNQNDSYGLLIDNFGINHNLSTILDDAISQDHFILAGVRKMFKYGTSSEIFISPILILNKNGLAEVVATSYEDEPIIFTETIFITEIPSNVWNELKQNSYRISVYGLISKLSMGQTIYGKCCIYWIDGSKIKKIDLMDNIGETTLFELPAMTIFTSDLEFCEGKIYFEHSSGVSEIKKAVVDSVSGEYQQATKIPLETIQTIDISFIP